MRIFFNLTILFITTVLLLGAWILSSQDESYEAKLVELAKNKSKWTEMHPKSFEYEGVNGCMFLNRYKVKHENGRDIQLPIEHELIGRIVNIDSLFRKAEKAIRVSYKVDIEYHSDFGFPKLIKVDWDKDIIDDECFYKITNFKVSGHNEI